MHEFLNYELLGLVTVKTYLITTFLVFIVDTVFDKKGKSSAKLVCGALLWPVTILFVLLAMIACLIVGIVKVYKEANK